MSPSFRHLILFRDPFPFFSFFLSNLVLGVWKGEREGAEKVEERKTQQVVKNK